MGLADLLWEGVERCLRESLGGKSFCGADRRWDSPIYFGRPDAMKLLLLGTGGYHPCERRQTACLMLPEAGIVLEDTPKGTTWRRD